MIEILQKKLVNTGLDISILNTRWEEYKGNRKEYNLILACNSLHLTDGGIKSGMKKVFSLLPEYVCLISEINQSLFIDFKEIDAMQQDYQFLYIKNYRCDSSFVFEDEREAEEFTRLFGFSFKTELIDGKILFPDWTDIAVLWWERLS